MLKLAIGLSQGKGAHQTHNPTPPQRPRGYYITADERLPGPPEAEIKLIHTHKLGTCHAFEVALHFISGKKQQQLQTAHERGSVRCVFFFFHLHFGRETS